MKLKNYKTFIADPVIYGIQNIITNKWYIGSCKNFRLRVRRHYYYLRINAHHSEKLQRSWNKYGEDSFEIIILKQCNNYTSEQLLNEEEIFIKQYDSYQNGYNMTNKCTNYVLFKLTDKQKEKFIETRRKKVTVIDGKTGKLLETLNSLTEVSKKYNVSTTNISKCCKGKFKQIKGLVFVYAENYDPKYNYKNSGHGKGVPKSDKHKLKMRFGNKQSRVVYKYDLNKNLIATYISRAEAERENSFKKEGLRYNLDKNLNGFIYSEIKYEKDIV